ncbi:hypothetical protein U9M48_010580 [Paspalum notatum var. saurae]|uniref:J domain-containing protein n=1 Tax=Paspalum notatum var. saurae TaxID=547442 RepID=A0AAQ3STR2_PASNO
MSWGRFSFSSRQGQGRARWCPAQKPAPCTVVVIDEDDCGEDGSDSDVFIVDAAAPGCRARSGSSSSSNVINIDDDEDAKDGGGGDKAGPSNSRASGSPESMTPGRGSPGNRYGLDCSSDSSESDTSDQWDSDTDDGGSSDCEILDDSAGTAREMWEMAASRKKAPHGAHQCQDGRAAAFSSCAGSEAHPGKDSDGLFGAECHLGESFFQSFTAACKEGPDFAQCSVDGAKDGHGPSVPNAKECSNGNFSGGNETEGVQNNTSRSKDDHGLSSAPNAKESSNGKEGFIPEKASQGVQSPHLDETFVFPNRVFPGSSSADRKDGSPPMSVSTPEKIDEKMPEGVYSQKDQSPPEAYNNTDTTYSAQYNDSVSGQQKQVPPFTSRCDCPRQFGENCQQVQANSCACAEASNKNILIGDPEELGQFASVHGASVIGEREKHKESAEYKRAAEEEWASRQRQLQIQAEEAKKLRKRKKAEAQRLLDMEKRQKQRLQEVRESQRKNEEAIQLKEQHRGVVRKELEEMERRYCDMTSILYALGIPVEGGEVKAYKQALLKFHPDRVSRNDVYQQVRAEETFKFISRLKEKLQR